MAHLFFNYWIPGFVEDCNMGSIWIDPLPFGGPHSLGVHPVLSKKPAWGVLNFFICSPQKVGENEAT